MLMPLLARETDLYPDDLLEPCDWRDEGERVWQVAHTLPRREKDLARRLLVQEVPFYLPQIEEQYRSPSGRRRTAFHPLFPNYLFLKASDEDLGRVLGTGCVARLLAVADVDQFLFDLQQIYRLIQIGQPFERAAEFSAGTPIRVTTGPFQGFEGQVIKHQSGDRLLVLIDYLQQGISVSLDGCEVERI
jgi:transcriptional antiterminator RfaH